MKISKAQLKSIIKECLVEILAEGIGDQLTETVNKRQTRAPQRSVRQVVHNEPDQTVSVQGSRPRQNFQRPQQIHTEPKSVFEEMLAETASNMPDEHTGAVPTINIPINAIASDKEMNKWAKLAFMDANGPLKQ